MKPLCCALMAALLMLPVTALAQAPALETPPAAIPAEAALVLPDASAALAGGVRIPVGTPVAIEITEPIRSHVNVRGDTFALRLAEPILIDGRTIAPAGAVGGGEVVDAGPSDSAGEPGKLVVSARYLDLNGERVPLSGMTIAVSGLNRVGAANNLGALVSPFFLFMEGEDIEIPAGTRGEAIIADASPLQGSGMIVFYRPDRRLGRARALGVREGELPIARLRNRNYSVHEVAAGIHEYQTTKVFLGPMSSRPLRLDIAPGQTYYIEHAISFLTPTAKATFESFLSQYTFLQVEPLPAPIPNETPAPPNSDAAPATDG